MPTASTESETPGFAELITAAFAADNAAPPCFYWTGCGQRAALEKAGRSVCRRCAAKLCGTEYPLRNPSADSLYASDRLAAEALDMLEEQPDADPRTQLSMQDTSSEDSLCL
jgi:hypothetical protein